MTSDQFERRVSDRVGSVSFLGTYSPRRCGIATFTHDLLEAVAATAPQTDVHSVAMNDRPEGYKYGRRVWFEINQNRLAEYRLAADFLNASKASVVCVQHEFGIFGGPAGQHLTELLRRLRMPVVTTLHTILKDPNDDQRTAMAELAEHTDRFVVLAERAKTFLHDIYKLPEEKVQIIPHGIPDVPFVDPNYYKDQFGVEGRKTILTFGLLSPNKGIENMLDAMPAIVEQNPDVVYIILGATHPGVVAHSGEEYRLGLKKKAESLGVADNVIFVNKFVELDELCEFLGAADVYVTPYHNEEQICSGTLAYALGTGNATVSTPYWYAQEMLDDERGILVPFKEPERLSQAVNELFTNEVERHAIRKNAYTYTRSMRWEAVANQYLDLFAQVREERQHHPKPVYKEERQLQSKETELAEINLDHLRRLTDDTGILHTARSTVPIRSGGYTTDDNALALVAVLMAEDHAKADADLDLLANRYLAFLADALDPETHRFRDTMKFSREWVEQDHSDEKYGSDDTHARALWALGEAVARTQRRGHMALAMDLFHQALPAAEKFTDALPISYGLIGIHAYLRQFGGDSAVRRTREQLAGQLMQMFTDHASEDWPWYTNELTYANPRVPHALLLSGRWMFDNGMIECALRALEWLWSVETNDAGQFAPVGTQGWFPRDGEKAQFDQLPLEAASMVDACLEAFRVTDDKKWVKRAYRCLNWFMGDNVLSLPLYDTSTGGCCDRLMPQGLSEDQSAQGTLSWLLSLMAVYDYNLEKAPSAADRVEDPNAEIASPDEAIKAKVSGSVPRTVRKSRANPKPVSSSSS